PSVTPPLSALSLHGALPISLQVRIQPDTPGHDDGQPAQAVHLVAAPPDRCKDDTQARGSIARTALASGSRRIVHSAIWLRIQVRSEEHTSELQSRENLVCRL